jgi:VCBS repeat-containing protein
LSPIWILSFLESEGRQNITYIPSTQSFLDVSQSTSDSIWTNNRKIAIANNVFSTDGGAGGSYTLQTDNHATITSVTTLSATASTFQYADATSAAYAVTLPAAGSSVDKVLFIKKIDSVAHNVTVTCAGSDTIEGSATVVLSTQYQWIWIQSDGTSVWKVLGRTVPSSGIAPGGDTYLLVSADVTNLPNSRTLTAGANIFFTDGGAGSTFTIATGTYTASSGSGSLTSSSNEIQNVSAAGGATVITLPTAASQAGKQFTIKKSDSSANTVTVTRASSDTIDGATTFVLSIQYQAVTITADGTSEWWIS